MSRDLRAPNYRRVPRNPVLPPAQVRGVQGMPLRECPYCGRPVVRASERACEDHSDLPGLEPL